MVCFKIEKLKLVNAVLILLPICLLIYVGLFESQMMLLAQMSLF